jgi:hypothetical protein
MQGVIVDWLKSKKEDGAANWFETYWTGEHGNYTNATPGHVGNNKSAGIESHWKYMRRDTVGKRTGLKNFIPMLIKYLSDLSKRHADKLLCRELIVFHPCLSSQQRCGRRLAHSI